MLSMLAEAGSFINYSNLGLDPVALDLGFFQLRWYSLAYLAGILIGYWYLTKLVDAPGAPMARRHADDMIFYATLGIILGGRIGYVLFYQPSLLDNPVNVLKVWEGGMSLHGGALGTILAIFIFSRVHKLQFLRICDYVACCIPFGLFFGRLANFVNGELWGRTTDVPWAVIFPTGDGLPRHPSQLYEAGLEGVLLFAILWYFFWKTQARYKPGFLMGVTAIVYGASRFFLEYFRQPDRQLQWLADQTGLSMGQWLTIPMILLGLFLVLTAKGRRQRIEPVAGQDSIA